MNPLGEVLRQLAVPGRVASTSDPQLTHLEGVIRQLAMSGRVYDPSNS